MHIIALTGSVASGKSAVSALFREWGATVIDADALVRELQHPGQPVFRAIVDTFGPAVLAPGGELDRRALRRRILRDTTARRQLESIVHPALDVRRQQLIADARARGVTLVIAEIPLLFEASDPAKYDGVIVVEAPVDERRRRLVADRGFPPREADQLIATQLPDAAKRARATWVIDNDTDRATLETRARTVWQALPR